MYDLIYLESLMGSKAAAQKFIRIIIRDAPQLVADIQKHCEQNQYESLSISAHSLKTQFNYIQSKALAHIALTLETPDTLRNEELNQLISQLSDSVTTLVDQLKLEVK